MLEGGVVGVVVLGGGVLGWGWQETIGELKWVFLWVVGMLE